MALEIKALDTAVEAAKDFLQKVITPPLEEVGLLFADQVKLWRFRNQVNILNKAEAHLKAKNIKTKKVSLKILTPLLEHASIEEEKTLQERWAELLANTLKENSQIDSTVFSYILSQMSLTDVKLFDFLCRVMVQRGGSNGITYAAFVSSTYIFKQNDLEKQFAGSYFSIDNLIRLRLIQELNPLLASDGSIKLSLTHLGFSFMAATNF